MGQNGQNKSLVALSPEKEPPGTKWIRGLEGVTVFLDTFQNR